MEGEREMEGEKKMVGQRDMVCEREMAGEKAWNSYARACLLVVAEMEGEKKMVGPGRPERHGRREGDGRREGLEQLCSGVPSGRCDLAATDG